MDIYLVIGDPGVGKSSLVRALTGVRATRHSVDSIRTMEYATLATPPHFTIWAKDASLQEVDIPPEKIIDHVKKLRVDAVLLVLWVNGRRSKGRPQQSASVYINKFLAEGWSIKNVAQIVGGIASSISLPAGVICHTFTNLKSAPFNRFVSNVRASWNWI